MANFRDSLTTGKSYENEVCEIIRRKYPKAFVVLGYCKEFDIFVPEVRKKVEVKMDIKSEETGNFVVEIEFNGKPSGLMTTTADYWVFIDLAHYYWVRPSNLKLIILEAGIDPAKFIGDGDSVEKRAFLLKKSYFNDDRIIVKDRHI